MKGPMTHPPGQPTREAMQSHATLSPCRTYRYWLERSWGEFGDFVNFVMLNPSTADENENDPTIRKCIGFAQRWGYVGVHVVNLFAFRATDPDELRADLVGPSNDTYIQASVLSAAKTIVAWGGHRLAAERAKQIAHLLDPDRTFALRINGDGSPAHPLYIPYSAVLVPWPDKAALSAAQAGEGRKA